MTGENNTQARTAVKKMVDPAKVKPNPRITTQIKESKDPKKEK